MPAIRNNFDESRFDAYVDGVVAGTLQYRILNGQMWLLDLEIDSEYRRLGLKDALVQKALIEAHRRRLAVLPFCHDARRHIIANPVYIQLVPAAQRKRLLKTPETRRKGGSVRTSRVRQQAKPAPAVRTATVGQR
jgi:predicted GNAT family acetyltransferase